MLLLGVIAFGMELGWLPLAPALPSIVQGKIVEQDSIQSLHSSLGNPFAFFDRPIPAVLGVMTARVWTVLPIHILRKKGSSPAVLPITEAANV